eukprot:TRINITY_DN11702_c0_g1_i1.p3 TRINITY_DN11702_c0_g1~~TRINITY_DN11702_c0_g1_i1.p3  ORF type:complete len:252 (+),score=62.15 TRINITY_DN11702_c0_g1_i1:106-861(+)
MLAFHSPATHQLQGQNRMFESSHLAQHNPGFYPTRLPLSSSPPTPALSAAASPFTPHFAVNSNTVIINNADQFAPPKQVVSGRISPPARSVSPPATRDALVPHVQQDDAFTISAPKAWARMDLAPGQTLFISPRNEPNQFCENLSVVVESVVENQRLQDYTSAAVFAIGKDVQNRILYSGEASLSGIRAHEVVYSSSHNGVPLVFRQVWLLFTLRGVTKAFVVTVTCESNKYQPMHQLTQQMVDSFRIMRA